MWPSHSQRPSQFVPVPFESVLRIRISSNPCHFPRSGSVLGCSAVGSGSRRYSNEHNKINWKGIFNKVCLLLGPGGPTDKENQVKDVQGGLLNRGLKRLFFFFSVYRPSCHIEAYIRPEKYSFVWAGPLANHHSILTSFFLATAEWRRRKERYVLWIWTAAFQSHSAATDGRRAAKLA